MNGTLTSAHKHLKSHTGHIPALFKQSLYIPTSHFLQTGFTLSSLQCGTLLQSLTNTKSFAKGQQLHAHVTTCGTLQQNTYLNTKLAAFYASCGRMAEAQLIFDAIGSKNNFLWSFMIRGYACSGCSLKSLALYREMLSFGWKADKFTYPFVLKACGDLLLVDIGRRVHGDVVISGLESDIYVSNSLLAMYSKFGDMGTARVLFDRMPLRDITSWNTMISGYLKNNNPKKALVVFDMMANSGFGVDGTTLLGILSACAGLMALKPGKTLHGYIVRNNVEFSNKFLRNALIEMYCSCSCMAYARQLFDEIKLKDKVSWNSMISGCEKSGDAFESLRLFREMVKEGEGPDEVTVVIVLGACDQITALQFGTSVHSCLVKKGFGMNTIMGTSLIDMYSKCGSLACSRRVFDEMPEKNLVSWSAMVMGYGIHGKGGEALSIFHAMIANNILPDDGVFTSVLSACSHAGLVNEGRQIFHQMFSEYNVKPTPAHYSCLVDLLGRAGHLDEAYELIKSMEVVPTSDIWAALLSACRLHQNVYLAEILEQKVFEMNPNGVGAYVCLSNIYAAKKRWDDVERVRAMVRRKGLKKPPGCSFVEVDKMVHQFLVGDRSHQQTKDIYAELESLNQRLKEAGYKPDTSSVFYNVDEEAKEKMLWGHSERLAIAFALINTGPGTIIRITKNLRVCGDCHTVTKLISKIACREIIMRDIHRFHHFKDGICSCGDYW
ncbi:putative pentatricopeptide repeat-containing protein At3g11460, mitochondrial [Juglans microcarpa x Juglans regia]|uniref:putative pentatricopeptide repeat-containing protein At3g11460, mitochondrial n=1 Tax=Juglans microcarpa x Juglans regia TaxID=2249226 RepID=UPI001B7DA85A|nr:putative pentatricopeptide repeat-containing protein At3g11460, mitochondrial [Juglans microcarpa x Juglans regia]